MRLHILREESAGEFLRWNALRKGSMKGRQWFEILEDLPAVYVMCQLSGSLIDVTTTLPSADGCRVSSFESPEQCHKGREVFS